MAGNEFVVNINGYGFIDVANETTYGRIFTYEEAVRWTLKRVKIIIYDK